MPDCPVRSAYSWQFCYNHNRTDNHQIKHAIPCGDLIPYHYILSCNEERLFFAVMYRNSEEKRILIVIRFCALFWHGETA